MSGERWRPIPGWEGYYEASDLGRIRSVDRIIDCADGRTKALRQRVLRPISRTDGKTPHCSVQLSKGNERKTYAVHALVLLAFVGPRPAGMETCHGNGQPYDNRLVNLRYDTTSANQIDSVQHGTHPNARKTHCKWGHPFDDENTYVQAARPNARFCLTCKRDSATRASKRSVLSAP